MNDADVGPTDEDVFEGATSETPPIEPALIAEPEKTSEPEKTEQPRDAEGKFAAKPDEPLVKDTSVEKPAVDDNGAQVPSWRVREINDEKRELAAKLATEQSERQKLQQQFEQYRRQPPEQPKPETKPDPLLDPEGYEKYIERKFDERLLSDRREFSLRQAHRTHKETFTEAYTAAQQAMANGDRALAARMNASVDPGETLVEWHREQKNIREVGNDLNAYKQRLLDEALKDPAYLAKAIAAARGSVPAPSQSGARAAINLPPSLRSVSGSDKTPTSNGEPTDEQLFEQTTG